MSFEILIRTLTDLISENEKEKSSHWQEILSNKQSFLNFKGNYGYGQYKEYNIFYETYHSLMQTLIFGGKLKEFDEYKLIKQNYKKFNRQVESDVVRHIFTFNLLNKFKLLKDDVAVIGVLVVVGIYYYRKHLSKNYQFAQKSPSHTPDEIVAEQIVELQNENSIGNNDNDDDGDGDDN